MSRRDKMLTVSRYLTAASGIPGIRYDGTSVLESPYPYQLQVCTGRVLHLWHERISELPANRIGGVIRSDKMIDSIPESWVGMRLDQFCMLIGMHYENNIKGRGE